MLNSRCCEENNEELRVLTKVCDAAMLTPRCIKRITNSYKILNYMWTLMNQTYKSEEICSGCLTLLCLSASSTVKIQNDLKKSFGWLERGLKKKENSFWEFLKKTYLWEVGSMNGL